MIDLEIIHPDGRHQPLSVPDMCSIGKGSQCEVRLDNWRLAKEHARLFTSPSGVLIDDAGSFGGVLVNGQRITAQYGPLQNGDLIGIGPFQLRILNSGEEPQAAAFPVPAAAHAATTAPMQSTQDTALAVPADAPEPAAAEPGEAHFQALQFEWRKRLHTKLIDTMDLRRHDVSSMSDEHLRAEADRLIARTLQDMDDEIPAQLDRNALRRQVLDEAVGLGPLEELLADETVSEIMVNRFDEIYVERAGRLQKHALSFTSDRAVMGVIERIVAPLGRRIDESSPMVDARLKDGSRVNAIIAPLALKGSTLTIRKFARRKLNAADLVQFGALSPAMADFLRICVEARKNIIVSGGTGSGKTTLLNILSNFIPSGERVITVEDAAELKLAHEHLISLESRPANVEGKGGVPIRELVRNTLRMRPDRIVVGECRGAEALDMLQAMNTGHEGSLTTLHANTPRDGLARLETMVLMAGMELPLAAIREQIASAVDIIVQQTRFACGTRLVTHICEVSGMESGKIQLQELFRFANKGYAAQANGLAKVQGLFTGCDVVPHFYDELRASGHALDLDIFRPGSESADLHAGERP
jgi:pilus assembly protein CpaF